MTKGNDAAKAQVVEAPSAGFLNFGATIGSEVESKLRFKPRLHLNNLTQGRLVNAELTLYDAPNVDKNNLPSTWEYRGLTIPTLHLTFIQEKTTEDPALRYLDIYCSPFAGVTKTGEAIEPAKIRKHYEFEYLRLRHIANAFKGHANYFEFENVGFDPFLDPIERLAGIIKYYEAWVRVFKGKDGSGYASQLNNIKVVANSQSGTYLSLPDFVGDGFIEKHVDGRIPSIELKPYETVVLVENKKGAKTAKDSAGSSASNASSEEAISPEIAEIMKKYNS